MEYVSTGSTGAGLFGIGYGMFTATEWCAIAGVVLTAAGVIHGIYSSRKSKKVQAAALARQDATLNAILEVLQRVHQEQDFNRGGSIGPECRRSADS